MDLGLSRCTILQARGACRGIHAAPPNQPKAAKHLSSDDTTAQEALTFADLGLSPKVLSAVTDAGYTVPTPIQAGAIPHALQGKDVLGIAQTGTGKTASFVLPMLTRLEKGRARARMPRTLILEPTRELAAQVEENFVKYGKNHKLNIALLIGGVSFDEQDKKLERGADVLIATPGRLLDHCERGKLLLNGVEILVIDEADRMLDMGFIPDIERICEMIPLLPGRRCSSRPRCRRKSPSSPKNSCMRRCASRCRKAASTGTNVTQRLVKSGSKPGTSARRCANSSMPKPTSSRTRSSSATARSKSRNSSARWSNTISTPARCMATWTSARACRCWPISATAN